jgi:NAD-dependent deacetylase
MSSNVEGKPVERARSAIARARAIAVLTGAGVSAESGIPTFRSSGGYWQTHRFEDLASPEGFARNPKMVWEWYEERRRDICRAEPNAGHFALARMEERNPKFTLVTQNVDNLHARAGSKNILRLHGDIFVIRCTRCPSERVDTGLLHDLPPMCECGAMMRPGVVWFGEMLPEGAIEAASAAVQRADVFLVAGTSAQVYPAAGLIPLALRTGATVIEINPDETDFSESVTFALRGTSADLLPRLL